MGNRIISYNELAELNTYLSDNGYTFKVHMHDLCGSQSFSVKALDGSEVEELGSIQEGIRSYFLQKGITPGFSENGMEFVLK